MGQEIRTLVNEFKPIGSYQATWNGQDDSGNIMPTGQYFYKLQAGNETSIKRMTLVK
jgi:flagellar hook assembly protein FlgD